MRTAFLPSHHPRKRGGKAEVRGQHFLELPDNFRDSTEKAAQPTKTSRPPLVMEARQLQDRRGPLTEDRSSSGTSQNGTGFGGPASPEAPSTQTASSPEPKPHRRVQRAPGNSRKASSMAMLPPGRTEAGSRANHSSSRLRPAQSKEEKKAMTSPRDTFRGLR